MNGKQSIFKKIAFIGLLFVFSLMTGFVNGQKMQVSWTDAIFFNSLGKKANKLEDFSDLYISKWTENIEVGIKQKGNPNITNVEIQSCKQLIDNKNLIYKTMDPTMWDLLMGLSLNCEAMKILQEMKPYSLDLIQIESFKFYKKLPDVSIDSDNNEQRNIFSGLNNEIVWDRCYFDFQCEYETKEETYLITSLGMGDYNNDNIADVIIIVDVGYKGGTGGISMGFVLTQSDKNGKISVLKYF